MASASQTLHPRLSLTFSADDIAKLRAVRDALEGMFGRASYVSTIRYALTLAAAHLSASAVPPVPLSPKPPDSER
jgi:hypothetical protein